MLFYYFIRCPLQNFNSVTNENSQVSGNRAGFKGRANWAVAQGLHNHVASTKTVKKLLPEIHKFILRIQIFIFYKV